ncbi:YTH domain-containing protein 1 isoform X2 [Amborella trichopoda]|uniref:YTH domain-containing protein 1 isoform X2 n=1 Tax=Amborella trichopoda TaxID=13333 RepID=UPI0009BD30D2|nr:YTH domain-containing protein 1 isoform X2 [Amborella trichopoda]|eukprot:XP_020517333.1 YTH domain-containing protein 1 isoform X2 [Amborella trichopoda]
MGVKIAFRHNGNNGDDVQPSQTDQGVPCVAASSNKVLQKSQTSRRIKGEKSVLDDIMGDPDDFGDLDVGSDGDGGRWEDTCKMRYEEERILEGKLPLVDMDSKGMVKDSSIESLKENGSIVDSSLTDSKHDLDNLDDPGSSSLKANEHLTLSMAEERANRSCGVGNSCAIGNRKMHKTRYFVIKSLNHQNIQLSIEKGIWATQVMNEQILEEAFHSSDRVILIFSVNMSGFFQGYAQMMSPVGWRRENVWSGSSGGSNPWGRTFKVKWLQLNNLAFQKTLHLKNPLNDYKPVKISRDCQELTQEVGEALCELLDGRIDMDGKQKRESSSPLPDEDYSQNTWARTPMHYPPLCYPNVALAETQQQPLSLGTSSRGSVLDVLPPHLEGPNVTCFRQPYIPGKLGSRHADRDSLSRMEINKALIDENFRFMDGLSDEDILDMTYEDYLRVHGLGNETPNHQVAGLRRTIRGTSAIADQNDDQYLRYLADWYRSQKGTLTGTMNIPHK